MAILSNSLSKSLGTELPIFGFSHSLDTTIAISRAGGIGIWGATRSTPEEIEEGLTILDEKLEGLTYGVDLVIPPGMPDRDNREDIDAAIPGEHKQFVEGLRKKYEVPADGLAGKRSRFVRSEEMARRQVDVVMDFGVKVLALGIGSPEWAIEPAKEGGMTLVSLVGQPKHAERAIKAGADILVAQGHDAGAHTGPVGTFSLVPRIVDVAGDMPVIAAGGVATGRHIAASLALGAVGVWIGTAWLQCAEEHTPHQVMAKLAAAESADTVISRADSGKTLRQIRTSWTDEWDSPSAPKPLGMPYQDILVGDILGQIERHEIEPLMHTPAGQSIAYFNEPTTVDVIMKQLVAEALATLVSLR
jgi:NAD(P)H-dependent flavin oxidoreductase YrpB (nitropropane dioxygenase family)